MQPVRLGLGSQAWECAQREERGSGLAVVLGQVRRLLEVRGSVLSRGDQRYQLWMVDWVSVTSQRRWDYLMALAGLGVVVPPTAGIGAGAA
jgi:hypothetical protein